MKIIRTVNIVLDDASETSVTARSNVFLYSAIRASRFSPPANRSIITWLISSWSSLLPCNVRYGWLLTRRTPRVYIFRTNMRNCDCPREQETNISGVFLMRFADLSNFLRNVSCSFRNVNRSSYIIECKLISRIVADLFDAQRISSIFLRRNFCIFGIICIYLKKKITVLYINLGVSALEFYLLFWYNDFYITIFYAEIIRKKNGNNVMLMTVASHRWLLRKFSYVSHV